MRYVIALVLVLVALSPGQLPLTTGQHGALAPWGGGGPDSFGYRYLDSDTTCPGSPTYNWVDIKGYGTEITGLGDDNYVGPFPIGFEFPYYWYRVDTVYVGADGYITFTHGSLPGLPPNPVPDTSEPNNTVAPLLSDLDCSSGGSVWRWTSADADTFIIEYDSIRFWSTGGINTFQIILSRPDSTITIQYREQSGAPYGGWAPENNQTGIENVSGAIGLNYLSGMYPPQNMYHDSLAVLFIPPESTAMRTDSVWLDSLFGPPDTVDTAFRCGVAVCCTVEPASVDGFWGFYDKDGVLVYSDAFQCDVYPGDSAIVASPLFNIGNDTGPWTIKCMIPTDSVIWRFRGRYRPGVEEGRPQASSHELPPTVLRRLPDGEAAFDATGRRVVDPRPGVYFVREAQAQAQAQAVRKVVLTK